MPRGGQRQRGQKTVSAATNIFRAVRRVRRPCAFLGPPASGEAPLGAKGEAGGVRNRQTGMSIDCKMRVGESYPSNAI